MTEFQKNIEVFGLMFGLIAMSNCISSNSYLYLCDSNLAKI